MNQATFVQRLMAWLVDIVILAIVGYLLIQMYYLLFAIVYFATDGLAEPVVARIIDTMFLSFWLAIGILPPFFYFGYFWSTRGRSIGMGMMNIRVVSLDSRPLSFIIAGLRGSVGYYISGLVFGLGYLWTLIDSQKRTWHDMIFKTKVIQG